ncbi:MAG: DUF418 domain-containing protein [Phycisphaerales bacterium]|nr:DUF418 domain-containing protein [Phycisphaerales bacterium]
MTTDPDPAAPPSSIPLGPVGEKDRIEALDVLRGFAIFGIFWVNIQLMARPFVDFVAPIGGADAATSELVTWVVIKTLFEFKFVTLFSLLFGMGLVVQCVRADAAGRPFARVYLRRLALLAVMGLAHAFFLWYGDILFMYSVAGLVLLPCARLKGRTLALAGAIILVGTGVVSMGLGALSVTFSGAFAEMEEIAAAGADTVADTDTDTDTDADADTDADTDPDPDTDAVADAVADPDAAPDTDADTAADAVTDPVTDADPDPEAFRRAPFAALLAAVQVAGPFSDEYAELERIGFAEGPFSAAFAVRVFTYLFVFVNSIFSFLWRIIAVFLIGAALMKGRFFEPRHRAWHWRAAVIGLGVGLPAEALVAYLVRQGEYGASWVWLGGEALHYFASLLLCAGYVGLILLIVNGGLLGWLRRGLAAVGRTALSNYLLQTVVGTFVMQWWGLGLFGTWERPAMITLVVATFVGQILVSLIWLRYFRAGPMEWLWRSATYFRLQPLRRFTGPAG